MKAKRIIILIIILFSVAALVSVGMIIKEFAERRQDITDFEKLEDLIATPEPAADQDDFNETEPNPTETECVKSARNLEPLFEKKRRLYRLAVYSGYFGELSCYVYATGAGKISSQEF